MELAQPKVLPSIGCTRCQLARLPLRGVEGSAVSGEGVGAAAVEASHCIQPPVKRLCGELACGRVGLLRCLQLLSQSPLLSKALQPVCGVREHAAEHAHHHRQLGAPARIRQRRRARARNARKRCRPEVGQLRHGLAAQPVLGEGGRVGEVGGGALLQEGHALGLLLLPARRLTLQGCQARGLRRRPLRKVLLALLLRLLHRAERLRL
mmetsp:Transcript_29524/g.95249  ORF Transcript_29524/g.95249 Transcript_29524/m.95249 type:complete len:208 (-) Transcript_29524:302-925(-)